MNHISIIIILQMKFKKKEVFPILQTVSTLYFYKRTDL